jgi:hypothetical protein
MGRSYKLRTELERTIRTGRLWEAKAIVRELDGNIDLPTALRILPMVAGEEPDRYDAWALRWLQRWTAEQRGASIDDAVDVAQALAEIPLEPDRAIEAIQEVYARQVGVGVG